MGGEPRSKSQIKRDRRLDGPSKRVRAASAEVPADRQLEGLISEVQALGAVVARFMGRGSGWLRLKADVEGVVWCKWRYTDLRYGGTYSLAVCDPSQCTLAEALEALENKVLGAYCNPPTHKPTPDVY